MDFDGGCVFGGVSFLVWDPGGSEIGVVHGIMDGYSDLERGAIVGDLPRDASPHRLRED